MIEPLTTKTWEDIYRDHCEELTKEVRVLRAENERLRLEREVRHEGGPILAVLRAEAKIKDLQDEIAVLRFENERAVRAIGELQQELADAKDRWPG